MKTTFLFLLLLVAACKSVPESQKVIYRAASREENAQAVVAILKCLKQPQCDELLGDRLECGPFLWRQLSVAGLTNAVTYRLPQNVKGDGSQDVTWEGRRCVNREEVRALWRAFQERIPQNSLETICSLNNTECRIYNALVSGEIREPVFILEGGGHKILVQLDKVDGRLTLTFIENFRNVVVRD